MRAALLIKANLEQSRAAGVQTTLYGSRQILLQGSLFQLLYIYTESLYEKDIPVVYVL